MTANFRFSKIRQNYHFLALLVNFCPLKCKYSSLRLQCWLRLFSTFFQHCEIPLKKGSSLTLKAKSTSCLSWENSLTSKTHYYKSDLAFYFSTIQTTKERQARIAVSYKTNSLILWRERNLKEAYLSKKVRWHFPSIDF